MTAFVIFVVAMLANVATAFDYQVLPLNRTVVRCTQDAQCSQCSGNCRTDKDCLGDLICFEKGLGPKGNPNAIPSCFGTDSESRTDWCVVDLRNGNPESDRQLSPRIKLKTPVVVCSADRPCEQCEGNCKGDDDCAGELVCFEKRAGPADNDKFIPSCLGVDKSRTDWCVIDDWVGSQGNEDEDPNEDTGNDGTPRGGELLILAYYYPWYHDGDWSRHGLQGNKPLLGYYGTDEPAIAEQHVDWAVEGGIDAWVVSWWGQDHQSDNDFFEGMLRARNLDKIQFCMLYERGALVTNDFSDPKALADIINDMIYFRDNFFDHPQYLRIEGRPMVVLYLTRGYLNFNRGMVNEIKRKVGVDIFFVADTPYFGYNANPFTARNGIDKVDGQPVFESYTSYNMFTNPRVNDGELATEYMFREGLPIYKRWAEHTTYFPHVLPMYHDFRGHGQLVGNAASMREQLEVFACLNKPMGNKYPNMLFMTSWNEWWEGSQLEPDEAKKYGFEFLDELRRFKDAGPAKC